VVIPVALAVLGLVSAGAVETLYGYGVTVYKPSTAVLVGAPPVSALGGCSAVALYVLSRRVWG
jgi:hypothetical protein